MTTVHWNYIKLTIKIIIVIFKSLLMEKILHLRVSLPACGDSQGILGTLLGLPLHPYRYWEPLPLHVNAQNEGEGLRGEIGLDLIVSDTYTILYF